MIVAVECKIGVSLIGIGSECEHSNLYISFSGKETFILVLGNHYAFILHLIFCKEFHISIIDFGKIACS